MTLLDRLRRWYTEHSLAASLTMIGVLIVVGVIEQNFAPLRDPVRMVALVGAIVPLICRRQFPFVSTVIMYIFGAVLQLQGGVPAAAQVSTLLGLFTVGTSYPTQRAVRLQLLAISPFFITIVVSMIRDPGAQFTILIVLALFTSAAIGASELSKDRSETQAELERRATELEAAQRDILRLAREDERAAIARELHDIVAHNVSAIVLQAGAAKRILESQPDQANQALDAIESQGRQALREMRLVVGVLRPEELQGLEPQPALHRLDDLIEGLETTGMDVQLTTHGDIVDLPPSLELSAFRIIQESLTNTMKHAGKNARATVSLTYTNDALSIDVTDEGGTPAMVPEAGSGHGHVGIAERVALFGGSFEHGPAGPGYQVQVTLPIGGST